MVPELVHSMVPEIDCQMVKVRAALDRIPNYVPGRSAESVATEHALDRAIKLASNEVPYPPTPAVLAAIAEAAAGANRYPDDGGTALRVALAARHELAEDQVLLGGGSVALCGQAILATCDAGDEVVWSWPSFEAYPILAQQAGATIRSVPLVDERYDLGAMAGALTDRTRCVFVCNPNNPTSTIVGRAALDELLGHVPADCLVVVDEAYREFVTAPDFPDGVALLRDHENVVVLRTFSKAYALAGLRVGYAFGRAAVIGALRKVRPPFGVSNVAQAAALAALADDAEMRRRVAEVIDERARVTAALRAQGYAVPDSEANFVWLPVLDHAATLGAYCEARGVVLRTFAGVGVRATIGSPEENTRLLEVLAAAVAEELVART